MGIFPRQNLRGSGEQFRIGKVFCENQIADTQFASDGAGKTGADHEPRSHLVQKNFEPRIAILRANSGVEDCNIAVVDLSRYQIVTILNLLKSPHQTGTLRWKGKRDPDHCALTMRP